jgi:hypothetical protein
MSQIEIPFSREMAIAAIDGRKIATTRSERRGEPGDTFEIEDPRGRMMGFATFRLLDVKTGRLEYIQYKCCRLEGCASPEEFEQVWKSLHRGHFTTGKMYFIHFFARVV